MPSSIEASRKIIHYNSSLWIIQHDLLKDRTITCLFWLNNPVIWKQRFCYEMSIKSTGRNFERDPKLAFRVPLTNALTHLFVYWDRTCAFLTLLLKFNHKWVHGIYFSSRRGLVIWNMVSSQVEDVGSNSGSHYWVFPISYGKLHVQFATIFTKWG